MENKHYRNISIIIDSIERQSDKEQKSMEEASEKLYKEKYEALKKEIKEKYRKQTEYELLSLKMSANKSASELESVHKAKLSDLREKITKEVYEKVLAGIEAFTKGENYPSFLEDSARKISALYDGAAKIYLRSADMKYADMISEAFGREISFHEDNSISLGGIKVLFTERNVIADDTLESRLEESKKDFIKNSGIGFVG